MIEPAFLLPAEVEQLTERKRYSAQRRVLDRQKIRYRVAPSGAPIVRRVDLDAAGKPAQRRGFENRWDLIGPKASVRNLRP